MNGDLLHALRREAREAPDSGIVEVFNYGRGREGLIPLWAGEGDLPTPEFICRGDASARSPPARRSTPGSAAFPSFAPRSPAITSGSSAETSRRSASS